MNEKATKASGGLREETKYGNKQKTQQQQQQQQRKNIENKKGNSQKQCDSPTDNQGRKRQNKGETFFTPSILLPYNQEWPPLEKLHNKMILDELKCTLEEKFCDRTLLERKRKLLKKYPDKPEEEIKDILKKIAEKKSQYVGRDIPEIIDSLYGTNKMKSLNPYVVFGVNSVTRYLERKKTFLLLLVCRSASPKLMTQHLLCLCTVEDIPACAVHDLSESISTIIGMKSCLALGFKDVKGSPFDDVISFIKDKLPNVSSPWLELWRQRTYEPVNINAEINVAPTSDSILTRQDDETCLENVCTTTDCNSINRKRKLEPNKLALLPLNVEWAEKKIKVSKRKRK